MLVHQQTERMTQRNFEISEFIYHHFVHRAQVAGKWQTGREKCERTSSETGVVVHKAQVTQRAKGAGENKSKNKKHCRIDRNAANNENKYKTKAPFYYKNMDFIIQKIKKNNNTSNNNKQQQQQLYKVLSV